MRLPLGRNGQSRQRAHENNDVPKLKNEVSEPTNARSEIEEFNLAKNVQGFLNQNSHVQKPRISEPKHSCSEIELFNFGTDASFAHRRENFIQAML